MDLFSSEGEGGFGVRAVLFQWQCSIKAKVSEFAPTLALTSPVLDATPLSSDTGDRHLRLGLE